jgi:hypothetical protein
MPPMPVLTLTADAVKALLKQPAPAVDTDYTDDVAPGFMLRRYKSGRAGYAFRYGSPARRLARHDRGNRAG